MKISNILLAQNVIRGLYQWGVRDFCLCAGARNAPLVKVLGRTEGIQLFSFFDERAAGFFALGRIKASHRPVAVVTTSGTAVAELLPACIEAFYQRRPLVMITADRPRSYRGTGAPQSMEQVGIFGSYAQETQDLEPGQEMDISGFSERIPQHINVCFEEPLLDDELPNPHWLLDSPLSVEDKTPREPPLHRDFEFHGKRPLLILGPMEAAPFELIRSFCLKSGRPIYAEALSQFRSDYELQSQLIKSGEEILTKGIRDGEIDSIIRIGGVPTLRLWRDLSSVYEALPVLQFSQEGWSGLKNQNSSHPFESLEMAQNLKFETISSDFFAFDRKKALDSQNCLEKFPHSEPTWIRGLSRLSRECRSLFLGNSLVVREWDQFSSWEDSPSQVFGNRGMNGIDGLISTFLGTCHPDEKQMLVLGDLSALYDMAGLWVLPQMNIRNLVIAIVNNGGGKIFERLFDDPLFQNIHDIKFSSLADMWGLNYQCMTRPQELPKLVPEGFHLWEIQPDEAQTMEFWRENEKGES